MEGRKKLHAGKYKEIMEWLELWRHLKVYTISLRDFEILKGLIFVAQSVHLQTTRSKRI
jgi:hypothetical protein